MIKKKAYPAYLLSLAGITRRNHSQPAIVSSYSSRNSRADWITFAVDWIRGGLDLRWRRCDAM